MRNSQLNQVEVVSKELLLHKSEIPETHQNFEYSITLRSLRDALSVFT